MIKALSDTFFAFFYQILLDTYRRFFPKSFLQGAGVQKASSDFTIYLKIIESYVYTLKKIEERGQPFTVKLQEKRLRKVLAIANKTVWWKSYFKKNGLCVENIKTLLDLRTIPPVNRYHLIDISKEDLLTKSLDDSCIIWRRTSGSTTGTPFVWGLNKDILIINVLSHFYKEMQERQFAFEPYGDRNFYLEFNHGPGSERSEFRLFSYGDFYIQTYDEYLDKKIWEVSQALNNIGHNAVIRTNPSALTFLIQELKKQGLHPPVLFCSVVGHHLEDEIRVLATEYLQCPVVMDYATQETGALAIECSDHYSLYHIFSERVILEILDDKGIVTPVGTPGNITVTCLDNTVMPLIRYQPGDIGVLHNNLVCTCENKSPLLEIRNRTTDVIKFSNGKEESAQRILKQFRREPFVSGVRRFQIRQDLLDEVTILLEVRKHILEQSIVELADHLSQLYEGTLSVKIKQVSAIYQDGPKFKVFVPLKAEQD